MVLRNTYLKKKVRVLQNEKLGAFGSGTSQAGASRASDCWPTWGGMYDMYIDIDIDVYIYIYICVYVLM